MNVIEISPPYVIFIGDAVDPTYAKTAFGMVEWRRDLCKGQITLESGTVDLGLPQMGIEEAVGAGIRSLLIGTASIGGSIPESWLQTLEKAALAGLDIVGGVHTRLNSIPRLVAAAKKSGAKITDVRVPPENLPVGTGRKRTGKRLLTVGTDCALGKKYTALALERAMKLAGVDVDFRASGQTGIMIAGQGIPIDAVVADFVSGAAEQLSPDNDPAHWDVIEGQGGIMHPGYSSVSLGLLVGSQPDAFVVCTEVGRDNIVGWDSFHVPSISEIIELTIRLGRQVNPNIRCVGISVNTSKLEPSEREEHLQALAKHYGLPCFDPLKSDLGPIVQGLQEYC